jgi:bifunctional non-homologous end joining protein LigD
MIKPMLCTDIGNIKNTPNFSDFIAEEKYDGIRAIFVITPTSVRIFSRSGQDITSKFPEFTLEEVLKCVNMGGKVGIILLDGEIIAKNQKFNAILSRVNTSNASVIKLNAKLSPVKFMAFDVLEVGNEFLYDLPLLARKVILDRGVMNGSYIEKVPFYESADSVRNDGEGVVFKRKMSQYYLGIRSQEWIKQKNYITETLKIAGYHYGEKKQNIVLETEKGNITLSAGKLINHFLTEQPKKVIVKFSNLSAEKMRFPIFIGFGDSEIMK